ncbi:uncharacterized protein KY384_004997 [Bacidia gigantensis]|uniref:uncharacterized protein n=1 Tax=Bacidia gigantensis TaxID=2732470 RepID=UPI001D03C1FD|nr:uncharacterized protein KY384_004997 [Bacidia gigantensis]KAG8530494.1 hypothetical protein KY384_004997 [Bacidia gigantensis]
MKFALSTAIAALIVSASAAPVIDGIEYPEGTQVEVFPDGLPKDLVPRALAQEEPAKDQLQKRANAGVYLCNDRNFQGYCVHIVAPLYKCGKQGHCFIIPNAQETRTWEADYGIVPLGGDLNDQDSEGHFGTYSPGYPDLTTINFNDKISSYYCNPN